MDGKDYFQHVCSREPSPYKRGKNGKYQCPCCKYFTLDGFASWDICPVCFWEDDGATEADCMSGANHGHCLHSAQEMYAKVGHVSEHIKEHVRKPLPDEIELGEL